MNIGNKHFRKKNENEEKYGYQNRKSLLIKFVYEFIFIHGAQHVVNSEKETELKFSLYKKGNI